LLFDHLRHHEEAVERLGRIGGDHRRASPPSVTTSSRSGRAWPTTEVIGSTPSVSTSASCSIHVRMPFSSWASGSRRSSGVAMRASRATLRTVAISMAKGRLLNSKRGG
jgi:hypothetical protein